MGEFPSNRGIAEPEDNIPSEYGPYGRIYATTAEVRSRFLVYEFATDKTDIQRQAIESLNLRGDETILEIGCADGNDLVKFREEFGHTGRLVGVDIDDLHFIKGESTVQNKKLQPIEFVVGHAEDLSFVEDNSVDVVTAWYMLYEVDEIPLALSEIVRVLKPEGTAVISTNGADNISQHRTIERTIAKILNQEFPNLKHPYKPPKVRSKAFNAQGAQATLPWYFCDIHEFKKISSIHIYSEDVGAYMDSLRTRAREFRPPLRGHEWMKIEEDIIEPFIDNEIQENGYLLDWMDRRVFVCKKPYKEGSL